MPRTNGHGRLRERSSSEGSVALTPRVKPGRGRPRGHPRGRGMTRVVSSRVVSSDGSETARVTRGCGRGHPRTGRGRSGSRG